MHDHRSGDGEISSKTVLPKLKIVEPRRYARTAQLLNTVYIKNNKKKTEWGDIYLFPTHFNEK